MSDFISKYIIKHEASMSDEWTEYDRFWTLLCLIVSVVGFVAVLLCR